MWERKGEVLESQYRCWSLDVTATQLRGLSSFLVRHTRALHTPPKKTLDGDAVCPGATLCKGLPALTSRKATLKQS